MTLSSFKNVALSSLLMNSAASGQRMIVIPVRSMSSMSSMSGGEPPCRQRRLEPWRQQIREQCSAVADAHCPSSGEPDLLLRQVTTGNMAPQPQWVSLDKEIDSLFESLFAPHPSNLASEADSLDNLFNSMLGFSLRAFDQMDQMIMEAAPPAHPPVDPTETEEEEEDEDAIPPPPPSSSLDLGSGDDEQPMAPAEQAAENVLDLMVTKLARSAAAVAEEDDTGYPVDHLPQRLFDFGNGLLSETHSRRRLMEGQGEVDTHLQVKERLGRRLTEYRDDLFSYPGTITLYTSSFPSSFMSPSSESILGMGSSSIDECMKSRFTNGDLEGGCGAAVEQFLLAVNDRTRPQPVRMREIRIETPKSDPPKAYYEHLYHYYLFVAVLFSSMMIVEKYFGSEEEVDEEETDEDANQFDYARLPEDTQERPTREGEPRVFMGVPVQIV